MLLVYHFDKNDSELENFLNEEVRLDLGFFPKPNTHIRLRMLGFSNNAQGGNVYLQFPDLKPQQLETELVDLTNRHELNGLAFCANAGSFLGVSKNALENKGFGSFFQQMQNLDLDLHLGEMDTQKDFFRIIVNSRRTATNLANLNNISIVLEMHHGSST
jgi:hypothetical protein